MQEENPPHDASTSDGVFVFDRDATSGDVQVGDKVTVAGMIDERFGETQIIATRVDDPGPADNRRGRMAHQRRRTATAGLQSRLRA